MNVQIVLRYLRPDAIPNEDYFASGDKFQWIGKGEPPTLQEMIDAESTAIVAAARAAIKPVTRRQMLTALHRAGLLATIKGAVAASGDVELQIAFDESQEFQRDNPFLATMAAALGKTDAEVDAIFALAASL